MGITSEIAALPRLRRVGKGTLSEKIKKQKNFDKNEGNQGLLTLIISN